MKRVLSTLISFALALVSCESDVNVLPAELEFDAPDFFAEIADETRTQLDSSNHVMWNEGDAITIFKKSDHNMKYSAHSLSDSRTSCSFTYTKEYVRHTGTKYYSYIGVYPYRETNTMVDNIVTFSIPAIQTYQSGNEFGYIPMVAKSYSLNLRFQAPSSVFRLNLSKVDDPTNPQYLLKSVTLNSATTDIAGMVDVNMLSDELKAVVDPSAGTTSKSVILDLEEGVELTTTPQSFFIALPVFSVPANDLTVTFEVEVDGKAYSVKKTLVIDMDFVAGRMKSVTLPLNAEEFSGSTDETVGGNIIENENIVKNDDGSYTCPITKDMILDEPLYLPEGKATLQLASGATLTNSKENANSALVVIEKDAELTIEGDGVISTYNDFTASTQSVTRAASNTAFPIVVNGTLIINDGDYTLNAYATSWLNCGIYVAEGGTLIINGGTFRSTFGSYIIGHQLGKRPNIKVRGGCFEGYNPSDNDFDTDCDYVDNEMNFASYQIWKDIYEVHSRTDNFVIGDPDMIIPDEDYIYLAESIFKNGGNAEVYAYLDITNSYDICYPVALNFYCAMYSGFHYCGGNDAMFNVYSDLSVNVENNAIDGGIFDSDATIMRVYDGGTITLNGGDYGYGDADFEPTCESLFEACGGDIVVNAGYFRKTNPVNDVYYTFDCYTGVATRTVGEGETEVNPGSVAIYGGYFEEFNPALGRVNGEVCGYLAPGAVLGSYTDSEAGCVVYTVQ